MTDALEKASLAYQNDALDDYLMGRYPYFIEEAYMAPANVPTNWQKAVEGLGELSITNPDVPARVENAIGRMCSSAEGLYCALATVLAFMRLKSFLPTGFDLDVQRLMVDLVPMIARLEPEARSIHLDWMGPTDEVLWDRIERVRSLLRSDYGV